MCCTLAVLNTKSLRGVVTFQSLRQSFSLITDTAAPVSTSARMDTPSTETATTLQGEKQGLEKFISCAVLASGTAAPSFPQVQAEVVAAGGKENGVAVMAIGLRGNSDALRSTGLRWEVVQMMPPEVSVRNRRYSVARRPVGKTHVVDKIALRVPGNHMRSRWGGCLGCATGFEDVVTISKTDGLVAAQVEAMTQRCARARRCSQKGTLRCHQRFGVGEQSSHRQRRKGCGKRFGNLLLDDTLYRWRQRRWSRFSAGHQRQLARNLLAYKLLDL